ncbi:MAG: hypothetical protein PVF91_09140 [Chromatiales bacterium]|jgi:hypothetical protein
MDWDACKAAFAADGFSRHIRARALTVSDWDRYYRLLRRTEAQLRWFRDGDPEPLPEHIDERPFTSIHRYMLVLDMAGVTLALHLEDPREIDFELVPDAVSTAGRATLVLRVMSTLGRRLDREVTLEHPEDGRVLFRYLPGFDAVRFLGA